MEEKVFIGFYTVDHPDDQEAFELMYHSGIPCNYYGPNPEELEPHVEYGYWRFSGIKRIKEFIERYKENKLPPLDMFNT